MKSKQWWRLIACGLLLATVVGNRISSQTTANPNNTNTSLLSVNICTDISNWEKPTLEQQKKTLYDNERYGKEIEQQPLKGMFSEFWNNRIFLFTEYGLSARIEPIYLSGSWSVIDDIWNCYTEDIVKEINSGRKAEVWLLGVKLVNLEWKNKQYYLTVEDSKNTFQIIQFERLESSSPIKFNVVDTEAKSIPFLKVDLLTQ
jgi:hypothetical protein